MHFISSNCLLMFYHKACMLKWFVVQLQHSFFLVYHPSSSVVKKIIVMIEVNHLTNSIVMLIRWLLLFCDWCFSALYIPINERYKFIKYKLLQTFYFDGFGIEFYNHLWKNLWIRKIKWNIVVWLDSNF